MNAGAPKTSAGGFQSLVKKNSSPISENAGRASRRGDSAMSRG